MKCLFPIAILAAKLVVSHPANAQAIENITISVRVYNYAGVENRILKEAQRLAATLLKKVSVGTDWLECRLGPQVADGTRQSGCEKPFDHTDVVLKLIPQAKARKLKQTAEALGLAVPTPPVGLGTVYIFVEQADRLAFSGPFPVGYEVARAVVHGHVIAHEIGHLLLGPGSHSSTGIMSSSWSEGVIKRMATAHLSFTDLERSLILDRLSAATQAVGSSGNSLASRAVDPANGVSPCSAAPRVAESSARY
jgi:hypothetical protein